MRSIDWSKAPADATHFSPAFEDFVDLWAKTDGHTWMYRGMSSDAWHFGPQPDSKERYIERPWGGEGLPPVGTDFEICNRGDGNWRKAKMLFAGKELGVMRLDTGAEYSFYVNEWEYRPIRTAEQIAADERAAAIEEIRQLLLSGAKGSIESVIYDAGYRKQVQS